MIDATGAEWLTVTEAARRLRVRPSAIRTWASRGKVRSHRMGRESFVHLGDVTTAEHAWRMRVAAKKKD